MSPEFQPPPRPSLAPRVLIGAFLVLMGLLLALGQMGLINADHVTRFWPVVLVLFGLSIVQRGGSGVVSGSIMVLVGGWLLLNTLHLLSLEPWQFLWPLILVVIGGRMIMRSGQRANDSVPPPASYTSPEGQPQITGTAPPVARHISLFGMMGGNKQRVVREVFRSAELTSLMGGCELDLREALLGADGVAYVEVFSLMGGAHIYIPPNWKVVLQVTPIMGGVEDKTRTIPGTQPQLIYVRGTVLMGGVEISN